MLRRRKRAIGSNDVVTVDFNPRDKNAPSVKSRSDGAFDIFDAPFRRNSQQLKHSLRGLKSTVTKLVKPTVLLYLRLKIKKSIKNDSNKILYV